MKNGERFKTIRERLEHFREWCDGRSCDNCELGLEDEGTEGCVFSWLDLEYKEELEKCPFCGGEAKERKSNGLYYVFCTNCGAKTVDVITENGAIDAWNRRV